MNYVINPIWFYLVSVFNALDALFCVSAGLLFIIGSIVAMAYIFYTDEDFPLTDAKLKAQNLKKWFHKILIYLGISMVLVTVTPSKEDMISMMIASCVTEENISSATNYGKDLVDYIFDKMDGVKEDD